jgi:hypothetical protein
LTTNSSTENKKNAQHLDNCFIFHTSPNTLPFIHFIHGLQLHRNGTSSELRKSRADLQLACHLHTQLRQMLPLILLKLRVAAFSHPSPA